jgi:hypothetical protein
MRFRTLLWRPLMVILLAAAVFSYAGSAALGQRLKGYEFERNKVASATRSIIQDYFKNSQIDSVALAVAYCDSINSPDSSWLSNSERYYIYFLCVDTHNLYKLDYYCNTYSLYDTTQPLQALNECRSDYYGRKEVSPSIGSFDNLESILFKTCKSRLSEYRAMYPAFNDIWDFWDTFVLQSCVNEELGKKNIFAFRKKHPQSPLAKLKSRDYRELQILQKQMTQQQPRTRNSNGGGVVAGAGFAYWPGVKNSIYPSPLSFSLLGDIVFKDILYQLALDVTNQRTVNDLIKNDTLEKGSSVLITNISINVGKVFGFSDKYFLTPTAGLFLFQTTPNQGNTVRFDIPFVAGARINLDYTHILGFFGTDNFGPSVRLSSGICLGDFKRISNELNYYLLYVNLTVGLYGFGGSEQQISTL